MYYKDTQVFFFFFLQDKVGPLSSGHQIYFFSTAQGFLQDGVGSARVQSVQSGSKRIFHPFAGRGQRCSFEKRIEQGGSHFLQRQRAGD
jgi:hypothetical protein